MIYYSKKVPLYSYCRIRILFFWLVVIIFVSFSAIPWLSLAADKEGGGYGSCSCWTGEEEAEEQCRGRPVRTTRQDRQTETHGGPMKHKWNNTTPLFLLCRYVFCYVVACLLLCWGWGVVLCCVVIEELHEDQMKHHRPPEEQATMTEENTQHDVRCLTVRSGSKTNYQGTCREQINLSFF